jgi:hypothetical protein
LRIIVIEHCSAGGCSLKEASEHCFLSIKVLLLVFLFSIFCYSIGILLNIYVYACYITSSALQVVSKHFPLWKLWEFIFRVEMCIVSVFKAQISIARWVKLRWGRLQAGNTYDFTGLSRNKHFTLLQHCGSSQRVHLQTNRVLEIYRLFSLKVQDITQRDCQETL